MMLFDVVFVFPETTLISLVEGVWDGVLGMLDGGWSWQTVVIVDVV